MKIVILSILFATSFFTPAAEAEISGIKADSVASYEDRLEEGIDAFYKTDWQRADHIFNQLKEQAPNDSRAYFFHSMIPFWAYYFGDNSAKSADKFLKRSQQAIEISLRQLQANPNDTTMVLMLSGLYGYQSLVAAAEKEYKTAVESGMIGFKYTRQLLSLDDDDPKALIGKGMFYYMAGSVPDGLKWVSNLMGLSGDREEGFRALNQAAASESYVSIDAKMILAYLYKREQNPRKTIAYLEDLVGEYPENIIFQYNLAAAYEESNELNKARQKYERVLTLDNRALQSLKEKSKSRLKQL